MGPQYEPGSARYNAFYHGRRECDKNWIDFDEATTLTALDWLKEKPSGPWCLWMPLIFPHLPFEVESEWYDMYNPAGLPTRITSFGKDKPAFHEAIRNKYGTQRLTESDWQEISRVYYGMVSRVDDQLGRTMAALEAAGELDNTIVVYLTDHGEYLGDFGLVEKWPAAMDRCILQNPVVMAGPGISEGKTASTFAEMVDIMPTLLELAGVEISHTHFGRSLVKALEDPDTQIRDCAFSEGGFRVGDAHLFEHAGEGVYKNKADLQHEQPYLTGKAISLRTSSHTYVHRLYEEDELYDRSQDPSETTNLITSPDHQALARQMMQQVTDWLLETSDVIPWKADPRFPRVPMGQHEDFHF